MKNLSEKEFDLGIYRQSLMKKAALIYDCMAELEKDETINSDLKSKTIEVLSAYSRSVNYKLEKTFKKDTLSSGPEVIY